jgi:hypothetical protein
MRWGRIPGDLKEAARIGHAVEISQDDPWGSPLGFKRIKILPTTYSNTDGYICEMCSPNILNPLPLCCCGHEFSSSEYRHVTSG